MAHAHHGTALSSNNTQFFKKWKMESVNRPFKPYNVFTGSQRLSNHLRQQLVTGKEIFKVWLKWYLVLVSIYIYDVASLSWPLGGVLYLALAHIIIIFFFYYY